MKKINIIAKGDTNYTFSSFSNSKLCTSPIMQLNSDLSNTNNTLHKLSRNVQKFDKIRIKEIEPTIQNIHENIFEEDIGIVIDKLVHIYFEELNEGKERKVRKKNILDNFNSFNINLQELVVLI